MSKVYAQITPLPGRDGLFGSQVNAGITEDSENAFLVEKSETTIYKLVDGEYVPADLEDVLEYDQKRVRIAPCYPSIGEQFDMQYWDLVNGTTTWKDAITAIKEAHPKP